MYAIYAKMFLSFLKGYDLLVVTGNTDEHCTAMKRCDLPFISWDQRPNDSNLKDQVSGKR